MKLIRNRRILSNPFFLKNWEADIAEVKVEPCERHEDPLGYRAVFAMERRNPAGKIRRTFAIGASLLAQRERNLARAGYKVPMTHRAIAMIEAKLGTSLPLAA